MIEEDANNLIATGVKKLLDVAPVYGYIILNLSRVVTFDTKAALGVRWQASFWQLVINPNEIMQQYTTANHMALALAHEALHLIWQHPIRYAQVDVQQTTIALGTDVAVNQYLPDQLGLLPNLVTRQTIFLKYGIHLPAHKDSADYIAELVQHDIVSPETNGGTNHAGWQRVTANPVSGQAALIAIMQQATTAAKNISRGRLPVEVQRELTALTTPQLPWRTLLRTGHSWEPDRREVTRARFNRRQPYRLDLFGKLPQQKQQLAVFIDQSASISDEQLQVMQTYSQQIAATFVTSVDLFAFDTVVHQLKKSQQRTRVARGGTVFQAIFDTLQQEKFIPNHTKVVIFTDGAGEKTVLNTSFQHVFWIIPKNQSLSIRQPFGKQLPLL